LGDSAGARASYAECAAHSPAAVYCLREAFQLVALEDKCDDALLLVRRLIALDPGTALYREYLATELYATGAPIESVRTAIEEAPDRTPPARRPREEWRMRAALAMLEGQLEEARDELAKEEEAIREDPFDMAHADLARRRITLAIEMGDR